MIEGIVGFVVVCLAVKALLVDALYAARWGKLPPRMQLKMAQLNAAAKAGTPPRLGFLDYLQVVWNDVWEAAIEARKAKRANPQQGKGPLRTFVGNWWNDAWTTAEAKRARRVAARQSDCPQSIPATPIEPMAPTTAPAGPVDPAATTPPDTGAPATAPSPDRDASPVPADQTDGQRLAVVIPLKKEDPHMPTPGEVSGLVTAQQYAAGMAQAMAEQVPVTESFVASLQANDVSGEAVAAAARAQELSLAASQAWEAANQALHRQDMVKEAYSAVPEAGTKQFVTSE